MMLSELLATNPDLDCEIEAEEGDLLTDLVVLVRAIQIEDDGTAEDATVFGAPKRTTGLVAHGLLRSGLVGYEADAVGCPHGHDD